MTLFWQALRAESTVAHISSSASQEVQLVPRLPLPQLRSFHSNITLHSPQKNSAPETSICSRPFFFFFFLLKLSFGVVGICRLGGGQDATALP